MSKGIRTLVKRLIFILGILFLLFIGLSFTPLPFYAYHWLGTSQTDKPEHPDFIVMMGGGGMPSQSNLMRSWYVAHAAQEFPHCQIVISIPGNLHDSLSTPRRVATELINRGIHENRILFEQHGTNTRSQALNLRLFHGRLLVRSSLLIVSSPEHMRRSILSFRKAGFKDIAGLAAFEDALEADLSFEDRKLGGNQLPMPKIGQNKTLRYQFWTQLKYEIIVARELAALSYYYLRGWI